MSLATLKEYYAHKWFHPVLVTEVTRMKGGRFCVAGWDVHTGRMVRPLPPAGQNWQLHHGRAPFVPGQLLNCRPGRRRAATPILPHCTEDLFLAGHPYVLAHLDEPQLYQLLLETIDRSMIDVFGQELIEGRYLEEGSGRRSLGGIVVPRAKLFFYHDLGRLRLHLIDADHSRHDLAVTDDKLLHYFSPGLEEPDHHFGEKEANEWLELNDPAVGIILRIGLARGWAGTEKAWNPRRCYAQLNGIICPTGNWPVFESRRH